MNKINTITLYEKIDRKNVSWEKVNIRENGDLELEGYDLGEKPLKFWGEDDYEYWLTIDKEWKDTILLLLAKERFEGFMGFSRFRDWLDDRKIPNSFANYV